MELTKEEEQDLQDLISSYVSEFDEIDENLGDIAVELASGILETFKIGKIQRETGIGHPKKQQNVVVMESAETLEENFNTNLNNLIGLFSQVLEDRAFLLEQNDKMKKYIEGLE